MKNSSVNSIMIGFFALWVIVPASWATHIFWAISTLLADEEATVGQMVLGGIGAIMPPVGVVHGVMIWLGVGA